MKNFTMVCSLLAAASLAGATYKEVFEQGIAKIRKGERETALALFVQASELAQNKTQKTNAMLQRSLAMPHAQQKEALAMLCEYRSKSGKLPPMSEAMLELRIGVLQGALKDYKAAEKTLSYALSLNRLSQRDCQLAYDVLSNVQLHMRQLEAARKTLDKWENIDTLTPNDYARILTRRAAVLGGLKLYEEAYKTGVSVQDIQGVSPRHLALAYEMCAWIAFSNEKDSAKALEFCEKGMAVKRGNFNKSLYEQIKKSRK